MCTFPQDNVFLSLHYIDTDHRLLKATMCTPTTRKAGRRYNKNPTEPSQDVKALHIPAIRRAFVESLDQKLQESPADQNINTYSQQLMSSIENAAKDTFQEKQTLTKKYGKKTKCSMRYLTKDLKYKEMEHLIKPDQKT